MGAAARELSSGVTAVYSTRSAFAALKEDGRAVTWGNAGHGALGAPACRCTAPNRRTPRPGPGRGTSRRPCAPPRRPPSLPRGGAGGRGVVKTAYPLQQAPGMDIHVHLHTKPEERIYSTPRPTPSQRVGSRPTMEARDSLEKP